MPMMRLPDPEPMPEPIYDPEAFEQGAGRIEEYDDYGDDDAPEPYDYQED